MSNDLKNKIYHSQIFNGIIEEWGSVEIPNSEKYVELLNNSLIFLEKTKNKFNNVASIIIFHPEKDNDNEKIKELYLFKGFYGENCSDENNFYIEHELPFDGVIAISKDHINIFTDDFSEIYALSDGIIENDLFKYDFNNNINIKICSRIGNYKINNNLSTIELISNNLNWTNIEYNDTDDEREVKRK
jgi:hypothetical protein